MDASHTSIAALLLVAIFAQQSAAQPQAHDAEAELRAGAAAGDEAVAHLIQGLSSRKSAERISAATKLGRLGPIAAPAVPFLIGILDDDEEAFAGWDENGHRLTTTPASCAASALAAIGPAGVAGLVGALQSRNAKVRLFAAQELRILNDPGLFEPLLAAGNDRNVDVRHTALLGLPESDPRMLDRYVAAAADRNVDIRALAADRLAAFDDPLAVDALIELVLHEDDVNAVCNAASSLADLGDPRSVPALLDALKNTGLEPFARSCAAASLGAFDDPKVYHGLLAAADDADAGVRFRALRALGRHGDRRAVPTLIERLSNGRGNDRVAAAQALGELGDARAVEGLTRALEDTEMRVRAQAAEALRAIEARGAD
jgi:HEAT repeat protein